MQTECTGQVTDTGTVVKGARMLGIGQEMLKASWE